MLIQPFDHTKGIHFDSSIFGLPLPDMVYCMNEGGKQDFIPAPRSLWVYCDPFPKPDTLSWVTAISGQVPTSAHATNEHLIP